MIFEFAMIAVDKNEREVAKDHLRLAFRNVEKTFERPAGSRAMCAL
jgi:hypothetical protein